MFITFNESYLYSDTIEIIKGKGCKTVVFVADNPFDPLRFSFFPISLKFFNVIFVHDRIWIPSITRVAPKSKIVKFISGGGFDPKQFYPPESNSITNDEIKQLQCDISFTGESYNMRGEAGYRSDIIDLLGDFDVKLWGDDGWKTRFPYYKNLKRFYQGGRLSYDHLRKLYFVSTINLNMPSPQIFTGFQPRTFEIAACKGFQIADWREELDEWFDEDELVTFKTSQELLEKSEYFVKNPKKRLPYIEKLYKKVVNNHTWEKLMPSIMNDINGSI
ncbi:Glycosyl transferases group 1 [anaerobic digester metagenome]